MNPAGTRTWCRHCLVPHTTTDLEVGHCTNCGELTEREEQRIAASRRRELSRSFKMSVRYPFLRLIKASRK